MKKKHKVAYSANLCFHLQNLKHNSFSFIGGGEGTHTPLFSNGADYILELNN
jgi:hypothetical protein